MEITILGTRGEIEPSLPYHSRHSGVLLDGKIMLDCGGKEFLRFKPSAIFITHLHPDHAYFMRGKGECPPRLDEAGPTTSVYAPEKYKDCKNVLFFPPLKPKRSSGFKVTAIPTIHSKNVKSQAYILEKEGKRMLYTGDMIWIDKQYHGLLKNFDLVITEASFIDKGGVVRRDKKTGAIFGHTGVPNLINLFKNSTGRIVFTHFGSWFYKDTHAARKKFRALAAENGIEITVGYDGMKIKV